MGERGGIRYETRKKTMSEEKEVLRKGLVARRHMTRKEAGGGLERHVGHVHVDGGENQKGKLTKTSD